MNQKNNLQSKQRVIPSDLKAGHGVAGDPQTGRSVCSSVLADHVKHPAFTNLTPSVSAEQDITAGTCLPNVFTPNQCMSIILDATVAQLTRATVLKDGKSKTSLSRTCSAVWLPRTERLEWMYQKILAAVSNVNEANYRFSLNEIQSVQVLRYKAFQKFSWHWDTFVGSKRKITAVFNLSKPTDYLGGGFQMHDKIYNKKYMREQGAGVFFPSFLMHRARAPWWGERWVAVAWILGEDFR